MREKEGIKPKSKTPEQALTALMRLCARAERSSGDALRLMARWGVDPAEQPRVLRRLIDDRFIDDRRYAEAFVREKMRFSGWGAYKIRAALSAKRIDREVIDEAMRQADPGALRERLEQSMRRRMQTVKAENAFQLKAKLVRYGLSQGYDYDTVVPLAEALAGEREK